MICYLVFICLTLLTRSELLGCAKVTARWYTSNGRSIPFSRRYHRISSRLRDSFPSPPHQRLRDNSTVPQPRLHPAQKRPESHQARKLIPRCPTKTEQICSQARRKKGEMRADHDVGGGPCQASLPTSIRPRPRSVRAETASRNPTYIPALSPALCSNPNLLKPNSPNRQHLHHGHSRKPAAPRSRRYRQVSLPLPAQTARY